MGTPIDGEPPESASHQTQSLALSPVPQSVFVCVVERLAGLGALVAPSATPLRTWRRQFCAFNREWEGNFRRPRLDERKRKHTRKHKLKHKQKRKHKRKDTRSGRPQRKLKHNLKHKHNRKWMRGNG